MSPSPLTNTPLRMRDLTTAVGLSRQAIHFYIAEGLLPPPVRKGRNAASYSAEHLERLRLIQQLQREHFLSLSAIKSVLQGDVGEDFSPRQRQLLERIRNELPDWAKTEIQSKVPVSQIVSKGGISKTEIEAFASAGLVNVQGRGAKRYVSEDDAQILDCIIQYKRAGATPERGYGLDSLLTFDKAIEKVASALSRTYTKAWARGPDDEAIAFAKAALPIDERLMAILLRKKLREKIEELSARSGFEERQDSTTAKPPSQD